MNNNIKAVVLAAGKGTRLHSEKYNLPKVMRLAAGRPLLSWVLDELEFLPKENIVLVTGYMHEKVEEAFASYPFALQEPQLGTGHAVMCAREYLEGFDGSVLVCYGDMPLIPGYVYRELLEHHEKNNCLCTILAGISNMDLPYGRIVRDEKGGFIKIVEDRDCNEQEKLIRELNLGICVFHGPTLLKELDNLTCSNSQSEYYLTDIPEMIRKNGGKIDVFSAELGQRIIGVNTQEQLDMVERCLTNG